jgi:hypothetical protein
MSKIDHERAKARDCGRDSAREDSEVSLLRVAGGAAQGRKVLRKVICLSCGHEARVAAGRWQVLRLKCSRCGTPTTL